MSKTTPNKRGSGVPQRELTRLVRLDHRRDAKFEEHSVLITEHDGEGFLVTHHVPVEKGQEPEYRQIRYRFEISSRHATGYANTRRSALKRAHQMCRNARS